MLKRSRFKRDGHRKYRRVLVLGIGSVGNSILAIPLLRSIRAQYPAAAIRMAMRHGMGGTPLLHATGLIEQTYFLRMKGRRSAAILSAVSASLWRPDLIIVPFQTGGFVTALLLRLSPHALVVGHGSGHVPTDSRLDLTVPLAEGIHERDLYLLLGRAAGIECRDDVPRITPGGAAFRLVERLLASRSADSSGFIALHPLSSANQEWKRWPVRHWRILAREIMDRGFAVALLGAKQESDELEAILPPSEFEVVRAYEFDSLDITGALLSKCRALVCADSGAMHLGASVDTAVIALMGPTDARRTRPLGSHVRMLSANLPCSPCYSFGGDAAPSSCPTRACMSAITPETVLDALRLDLKEAEFLESLR